MTACKVYDKNVMRAKAFEVSNPKTAAQTTQRDFFKQVQEIVASVSPEQLRSLFGIKPKEISRRNALAAQVAAAFSVEGNVKSVDFSKLQAIGNGEKVTTPIHVITSGYFDTVPLQSDMFNVNDPSVATLVMVYFDTKNDSIQIIKYENTIEDCEGNILLDIIGESPIEEGFCYATCDSKGENVYLRGFGSFIIKTRPEKKGHTSGQNSPKRGDIVSLTAATIGSSASLDFGNYDFNNLIPGNLFQGDANHPTVLVAAADWIEGADNEWTAEIAAAYDDSLPTFLAIKQGDSVIDNVPFSVVVE